MDKALFEYYQARNGDNRKIIAKLLDIHPVTLGRHLKLSKFSIKDIDILRERWSLTDEECSRIFLTTNYRDMKK